MKKVLTYLIFALITATTSAQQSRLFKALEYVEAGDFDNAKIEIDAATVTDPTANDAYSWYVKGFVYKELYKKYEKNKTTTPYRYEAINALKKSMELDVKREHINDIKQTLKFLASSFNNDAANYISSKETKQAQFAFEKYKEIMLLIDPQADLKPQTVEFLTALASMLNELYEAEQDSLIKEQKFIEVKNLYQEVLKIDPNNFSANYNLGILYYNKAVNIINNLDYEINLYSLIEIQDKCVEIFKKSLPYMEKALELQPNRVDALRGLQGIYLSLNEFDKYNAISARLEELGK